MAELRTVAHSAGFGGARVQKRAVQRGGWTKAKRQRFLAALAQTASITQSAKAAGVSKFAVYSLRSRDPEFRAAWREALAQGVIDLETELLDRARHGVQEPVRSGNKVIGKRRVFSDRLAMFLVNRHAPTLAEGDARPSMRAEEAGALAALTAEIEAVAAMTKPPGEAAS